jgi:hypothetical protein
MEWGHSCPQVSSSFAKATTRVWWLRRAFQPRPQSTWIPSLQGQESAQECRIQSSDSPCCFCLLLTERSVILPKPDRSFNNTILQKMNRLTQRHRKFLKRFKRSRDRWEPHSQLCDIQRMRQMEAGIIGLSIYFLFSSNQWIDFLLSPEVSWKTFLVCSS